MCRENDEKCAIDNLLNTKLKNQQELCRAIADDQRLQMGEFVTRLAPYFVETEAVQSLFESRDELTNRLNAQIELIQRELADLSQAEHKQRQYRAEDNNVCVANCIPRFLTSSSSPTSATHLSTCS